ncbi:hypothetical protein GCM10009733_080780 [Nonomuraea maheshkhaliensis]|uniref:Uncharacterized protein n=1 Tax=Nonomuraea maheshkhaliensis TaxID=419590 RepID=A0ABN2GHB9_9ACTN
MESVDTAILGGLTYWARTVNSTATRGVARGNASGGRAVVAGQADQACQARQAELLTSGW